MSVEDVDPTRTVEFEGYSIVLKRHSFECEGNFEKWVRKEALASVTPDMIPDPKTRQETLAGIIGEIVAGRYTYDSPTDNYVHESRCSTKGFKQWLFFNALQNTPFLMCKDGREWFDRLWKSDKLDYDIILENEAFKGTAQDALVQAWSEINDPKNSQPPSEESKPKAGQVATGSTSKSNP